MHTWFSKTFSLFSLTWQLPINFTARKYSREIHACTNNYSAWRLTHDPFIHFPFSYMNYLGEHSPKFARDNSRISVSPPPLLLFLVPLFPLTGNPDLPLLKLNQFLIFIRQFSFLNFLFFYLNFLVHDNIFSLLQFYLLKIQFHSLTTKYVESDINSRVLYRAFIGI